MILDESKNPQFERVADNYFFSIIKIPHLSMGASSTQTLHHYMEGLATTQVTLETSANTKGVSCTGEVSIECLTLIIINR